MSRLGHSAAATVLAAVALGCAASVLSVSAAEESSAPANDALAAAKREFDALKATRAEGLQHKSELPRIIAPELRTPPPSTEFRSATNSPQPEKKPVNWLVDAMEKPAESRKGRERDRELDRERSEIDGPETTPRGERDATNLSRREANPSDNDERNAPPSNPLTQFLGAWMTPQDYQLLKPSIEQSFNGDRSLPLGLPGAGSVTPLDTTLAGLLESVKGGTNGAGNNAAARPRENPYLASMNVAPLPAPVPMHVTPPPSPPLPPPVAPMPQPSKSPIPDFAKPDPDGKYFKQLKRF